MWCALKRLLVDILVQQPQPQPPPPQQQQKPQQEVFDFIIVGSNSAGAVLANRLTEIGHWRVLLLEAGDVPNPIVDVPYSASSLHFTNYSWNHVYLKQDNFGYGKCLYTKTTRNQSL